MIIPLARRRVHRNVRFVSGCSEIDREAIVWSYGGITKNSFATSIPLVVVFFRYLDSQGNLGGHFRRNIALTHLGLVRIGTIWKKGLCRYEAVMETRREILNFTENTWQFVSPSQAAKEGSLNPIGASDYPLYFSRDRNWLIDFSLPNDKNLLIPCLEFFVRCYGRSVEVRRILSSFLWETAEPKLYAPFTEPVQPGAWPIKLRDRLRNGDAVFLAHAKYEPYTHVCAKGIYSQIVSSFDQSERFVFLKVKPWFQGRAEIKISGRWINNDKTFLGLQINGCSDPEGYPIQLDRDNTNLTDNPAEDDGEAWSGAPRRIPQRPLDSINLTDLDEPDHGSQTSEIQEDDFEVLGTPRTLILVRHDQAKTSIGPPEKNDLSERFSTGEPYGINKGVGSASIHAEPQLESHGFLLDMWNAMQHLKTSNPGILQALEWFTFRYRFESDGAYKLVSLEPFGDEVTDLSNEVKNWLYFDLARKIPRGILIIRAIAKGRAIYIIEVQRRLIKKSEQLGVGKATEQPLRGLVFELNHQDQLEEWLKKLISDIRHVKGIVKYLEDKCPGTAKAFNHSPANNEQVACEAAVRNAFEKMGITL